MTAPTETTLTGLAALRWLADRRAKFCKVAAWNASVRSPGKQALGDGWHNTPYTLDQIKSHFAHGGKVGLLCGKYSDNLALLDVDTCYSGFVAEYPELAGVPTIIRPGPDKGKILIRITGGECPKSRKFKPPGGKNPFLEWLSDGSQGVAVGKHPEGGDYQLINANDPIIELDPGLLNDICRRWYRQTIGEYPPADLLTTQEKPTPQPATIRHDNLKDTVLSYWSTPYKVFDHFGWVNETRLERHSTELRLLNHGGLFCRMDRPVWNLPGEPGVGGGPLEAWYYAKYGHTNLPRGPEFYDLLIEMSQAAGIEIPQRSRRNGHDHDVPIERPQSSGSTSFDGGAQSGEPPAEIGTFNLTDAGNAETLAHIYGEKLRYDFRRQKWFIWNGQRWEQDTTNAIGRIALLTTRARMRRAVDIDDEKDRKKAYRWIYESENRSRLAAMVHIARSVYPIPSAGDQWDKNPWFLGCNNGIVDLRTGELRSGSPDDLITLSTGVDFDPLAIAPRFEQFLKEIFDYDLELIEFLQRAVGYSLTGDMREHVLFLCHGRCANGKSTLLNALRSALGEYATNTPFSTFELNQSSQTNDVAALCGLRFVTASETSESKRLNEARVKAISGGDPVTARFLFGEYFTYYPAYKVWLGMNHRPSIAGVDDGIWRRIRLIPFNVSFKDREDKNLAQTLEVERPGILAWAVTGAVKWLNGGLTEPKAVIAATEQYRQESDIIGQFLADCTTAQESAKVAAGELYKAYVEWCKANGEKELTGTTFGRRMKERGIDSVRSNHVFYLGIGVIRDS